MSRLRHLLTDFAHGRLRQPWHSLAFLVRCLCCCLAPIYWLGAQSKNWCFDRGWKQPSRLAVPVISIGNLSVGGTGKSPVVRWLVQLITTNQTQVAVLSRGYRGLESGTNDEALELRDSFPDILHIENPNRVDAGNLAVEQGSEVLILDDGFQHRRLARDLDIVLIDASEPMSLHRVLPAGVLREPFSNIRRAQAVLLTHADRATASTLNRLTEKILQFHPQVLICTTIHAAHEIQRQDQSKLDLESLKGQKVLAFCGIGKPDSFFDTLKNLGAKVIATRTWPDHHHFQEADVQVLRDWNHEFQPDLIVCTMKDWVKVRELATEDLPLGVLKMEIRFQQNESALQQLIRSALQQSGAKNYSTRT